MRTMRVLTLLFSIGLIMALAGDPVRAAPATGVILTVNNPYCVQPSVKTGACYINLRSLNAYTSDSSFSRVEISINGKVRLRLQSFFESSASLNDRMLGTGLQVPCGGPNASGNPAYGRIYQVVITGYSTNSPSTTDIANVTCPFYEGKMYLPAVMR
jgi:hypothetical protein